MSVRAAPLQAVSVIGSCDPALFFLETTRDPPNVDITREFNPLS